MNLVSLPPQTPSDHKLSTLQRCMGLVTANTALPAPGAAQQVMTIIFHDATACVKPCTYSRVP